MEEQIIKQENIGRAIVKTVAFFDMFNKPLTAFEIWQYLGVKRSLFEVIDELEKVKGGGGSDIPRVLSKKDGYWFLQGREEIVKNKTRQHNLANEKFKIAKKAAKKLFYHNGIRMIAACNNLYYKKESDIDLFIIVSKGRMWLTRALVTLIIHLARLRRYGKRIADRICLSFYVTEDNLNLKNIALEGSDPYLCYWLANLAPIYDRDMYNKFILENNWLKEFLPNIFPKQMGERKKIEDSPHMSFLRKIVKVGYDSPVGDFLEKLARKLQLKKMSYNINSVANKEDSRVIISDTILKFHESDRREEFKKRYREKLNALNIA